MADRCWTAGVSPVSLLPGQTDSGARKDCHGSSRATMNSIGVMAAPIDVSSMYVTHRRPRWPTSVSAANATTATSTPACARARHTDRRGSGVRVESSWVMPTVRIQPETGFGREGRRRCAMRRLRSLRAEVCDEPLRRRAAVAVLDQARELVPPLLDVEVGADPAVAADVRRYEVAVGRGGDERLLQTGLTLHPQRPALLPVERVAHREQLPPHLPDGTADRGGVLDRLREREADLAQPLQRVLFGHRRTVISSRGFLVRSGTSASSAG